MYLPLATDGLALITLVMSTVALSISLSGVNEIFPTGTMHQSGLVGAEFDFAGLYFLNGFAHIEGDRARLRVRHQALGAENFTQASDGLHHVGSGDQGVEVSPVFLGDLLDHLFAAGEIRPGRFGFLNLVAGRDDQNFFRLAQTVRQTRPCRGPSGRRAWDRLPGAS